MMKTGLPEIVEIEDDEDRSTRNCGVKREGDF